MYNRAILIGRLCADPELKYIPSGKPVARFTLAVDRGRKDENGDQETDFIRCSAWNTLAEIVANYAQKGRLVAVEGRIRIDQVEQQDGTKRQYVEIVCDQFKLLDRPKNGTDNE